LGLRQGQGRAYLRVDGAVRVCDEAYPGEILVGARDGADEAAAAGEHHHPFVQTVVRAAIDGDHALEPGGVFGDDVGRQELILGPILLRSKRFFEFPDALLRVLPLRQILLEHLELLPEVAVLLDDVAAVRNALEEIVDGPSGIPKRR